MALSADVNSCARSMPAFLHETYGETSQWAGRARAYNRAGIGLRYPGRESRDRRTRIKSAQETKKSDPLGRPSLRPVVDRELFLRNIPDVCATGGQLPKPEYAASRHYRCDAIGRCIGSRQWSGTGPDRKSTRLNSSPERISRMR